MKISRWTQRREKGTSASPALEGGTKALRLFIVGYKEKGSIDGHRRGKIGLVGVCGKRVPARVVSLSLACLGL